MRKTARYYSENPEAKKVKAAYDKKYHATDERKKYRAKLNRERRRRKLRGDDRDLSHKKNGELVLENKSSNRARQGADGGSTKK